MIHFNYQHEQAYNFLIQDSNIKQALNGYKNRVIEHFNKARERYQEIKNEFDAIHPLESFKPSCFTRSDEEYKASQRAMYMNALNVFILEKLGWNSKNPSWSYENQLVKKSFIYAQRTVLAKEKYVFDDYVENNAIKEMHSASYELYQRITKLIGPKPTSVQSLTFNENGCYKFTGVFIASDTESNKFKFKASIVYAGGWNIQRFHVRYVLRLLNK